MILFSGLLLSLFLEYVYPGNFVPVISAIKIGTIIPLLTFVFAVLQVKPVTNGQVLKQPTTRWILFFLFLLVVSVLTADVTLYSWTIFKFVLGYVFWYIMLVKLVTDLDRLKSVIFVLVVAHVLLLVLNPDVIMQPETRSYLRAAPFLGDGNDFSLSVCVLFPLCIWLLLTSDTKRKKGNLCDCVVRAVACDHRNTVTRCDAGFGGLVRISLVERETKVTWNCLDIDRCDRCVCFCASGVFPENGDDHELPGRRVRNGTHHGLEVGHSYGASASGNGRR